MPRPKSLLSGEFFPPIVDAAREVVRLNRSPRPRAVRLEAAGSDSAVMQTFSRQIAQACGLREDHDDGDFVVRLRPSPARDGWDVLFRLTTRPLSARGWRVQGHPAAASATVAAAMVDLSGPRPGDRVADLMCGSGTILVERLLAGPAAVAVGVDADAEAISIARANLKAAGQNAKLIAGDIREDGWLVDQPYDALFADPPWGDDPDDHAHAEAVHSDLLERAHAASARRARLVVLAHEIRVMDRCLQRAQQQWRLRSQTRVFHKGHHPRIYVLDRI